MNVATSARYPVGQLVTISDTVTVNGALTNPTTERVRFADPSGNVTTDQFPGGSGVLSNPSTGVFKANIDTTGKPGIWRVRWWSDGAVAQHADPDYEFIVDDSPLR